MTAQQKVAVVVPLFNAQTTIAATLRGILAQTHACLDIIVVDDGSTDASMAEVEKMRGGDPRIRCVRQHNAGAAAARNAGAALTDASYVAFCDADDLWAPRKIALQLDRIRAGGDHMALVYCWFARIDARDDVLAVNRSGGEGDLLATLLRRNVIGNGSSPLFRKSAFDAVGGFSDRFSPAEDLAIYLATAERFHIGVVNQVLVGYRVSDTGLSADGMSVYAATARLLQTYAPRYPHLRRPMRLHLRGVLMWQIARAMQRRKLATAIKLLRRDPGTIAAIVTIYLPQLAFGLLRGGIKDSWMGILRRPKRQAFGTLPDRAVTGGAFAGAGASNADAGRRRAGIASVAAATRQRVAR